MSKKLEVLYREYEKVKKGYSDGGVVKPNEDQEDFFDSVKKAFSTPTPPPPKQESREEKNYRIRKENTQRVAGQKEDYQGFSEGGKVGHNKKNLEELKKAFAKFINEEGSEKGYADGGEVEDDPGLTPEQFQQHLMDQQSQGKTLVGVNGDPQNINAQLPQKGSPTDISNVEELKEPLEDEYQNENFVANEKVPEKTYPVDDSEDEISDDKTLKVDNEKFSPEKISDKDSEQSEESSDQSAYSKLLKSLSQGRSGLKEAQEQRDNNYKLANFQKGMALMGAGIGGGYINTKPVMDIIDDQEKHSEMPVQKYNELIQDQKNDPDSIVSKITRQYFTDKGMKVPDNASANNLYSFAPYIVKDETLHANLQKALMQNKSKEDIADSNRTSREKVASDRLKVEQQKADAMKQNAEGNKDLKMQAGQDRALQQTKTLLESARGNPAAAQAEKDLYAVNKVDSLLKIYPDPNKMPEAQVNLLISEIGKIASGGVPTGHEMEALKPGSAESKLQALYGKLTNQPTPANAAAYLKEFKKYNSALKNDATKVIKDKYGRVIESSKKQLGGDNYKQLQDQYLNRFDAEKENSHPQDSEAVQWAKDPKNAQDPRAAAILKANGL